MKIYGVRFTVIGLVALMFMASFAINTAFAAVIDLSTYVDNSLGGTYFDYQDVVEYNTETDTANIIFDGNSLLTPSARQIDAFHILPNGNYLISTVFGASIAGLAIDSGDIVEYNPLTGTASIFFSQSLLVRKPGNNVDAVYVRPNGNIILSVTDTETLGGLTFSSYQLAEYNPSTDTATLFFDGSSFFSPLYGIDAFHLLNNGNLIMSTDYDVYINGLLFRNGDLIEYNPSTDIASLFFSEYNFEVGCANIDAVYVHENGVIPEPATMALLGLGLLGFVGFKKKAC